MLLSFNEASTYTKRSVDLNLSVQRVAVKESQRADCQFSLPCPAEQLEASHGRGLQLIGHDVAGDLDESKHGGNPCGSPPNAKKQKSAQTGMAAAIVDKIGLPRGSKFCYQVHGV